MQDKWYGDKRDIVKWGVLLELTRRYQVRHILQVLYLQPNDWGQLEMDGEMVKLPKEVVQHFRNTSSILSIHCQAQVEIVAERFVNREDYLQLVIQRIGSRVRFPGIVFLDPDTGLEPSRAAGLEHVLDVELAKIWRNLSSGDLMVFYQHQTNRKGAPWIEPKKAQFEEALGVPPGTARLARAPGIAPDVAFFYIEKNDKETSASD